MKWYLEITEWSDATPNGVYLMNDSRSKVYAFRSPVTRDIKVFKSPLRIDLRGRRFKVNDTQYAHSVGAEPSEGRSWSVAGSKGSAYTVTESMGQWACTCQGFTFRGRCKHLEQIKEANHA